MINIAPIFLQDEIALRRHLQLGTTFSTNYVINNATASQEQGTSRFKLPAVPDNDIANYIKDQVKQFDEEMQKVIKEVEYNLAGTNYKTVLLESNLNDNYATITEIAGTYATQTSVGAIYGIEVNANGHVSGYKSIATGEVSIFQIYAEKFAVSSSTTDEGYSPFQIDTVNHKINMTSNVAIDGNLLISGTVLADQIVASALDGKSGAFSGSRGYVDGANWCLTAANTSTGGGIHGQGPLYGVVGKATGGIGVYGYSTSGASGVKGSSSNWAIEGTTSNGAGQWGLATNQKCYAAGGYSPFTGSHIVYTPNKELVPGMVVSTMDAWVVNIDQALIHVDVSSARDKKVIGVVSFIKNTLLDNITNNPMVKPEHQPYIDYMKENNFVEVEINSVGEGGILVSSENGNIQIGDYLTPDGLGNAMKQDEEYLTNFTVAKSLEDVDWSTEPTNAKLIACTYHCG